MSNYQYDGPERRSGNDRREPDNRVRFDKTINLGHILTIGTSMVTTIVFVMVGWSLMDKRVLVLEEARTAQRDRDQLQDVTAREKFQEVRDALVDLRRSVEKVSDKVGAK